MQSPLLGDFQPVPLPGANDRFPRKKRTLAVSAFALVQREYMEYWAARRLACALMRVHPGR
jgi:hypothetical protein